MTTLTSPASAATQTLPEFSTRPQRSQGMLAWLVSGWRFIIGVVLCQHPLTSLLVVGWTSRIMRRRVLRHWWANSPHRQAGLTFEQFTATEPDFDVPRNVPRWLAAEEQLTKMTTTSGRRRRWFASLVDNARRGVAQAMNVFVWILPGVLLWYVAWLLGWTISFNKVYEQSHLGISLGLAGIVLFALAMLYVPMAAARQATTGSAAAFYDWRFNWQLVRRSAWGQFGLASTFAVLAAPLMIVRIAPYFVGHHPWFETATDAQLAEWLRGYYFWTGFLLLGLFILAWRRSAATYAQAARRLLQRSPSVSGWRSGELRPLAALGYQAGIAPASNSVRKAAGWFAGSFSTCCGLVGAWLVWSMFAVEIFVAQFFHYIPGGGWLNPPLVLLPWMRSLPPGLLD